MTPQGAGGAGHCIGDEWIGWGAVVEEARASRCFLCFFVVDCALDLVRELFLALSRRAHNKKHAVPF